MSVAASGTITLTMLTSDVAKMQAAYALLMLGLVLFAAGLVLVLMGRWGVTMGLLLGGGYAVAVLGGFLIRTTSEEYRKRLAEKQWRDLEKWGYVFGKSVGGWQPRWLRQGRRRR